MRDQRDTSVEELLRQARESAMTLGTIESIGDEMRKHVRSLDESLAQFQDDPTDIGARIVRSMVLRKTLENILDESVRSYQDGGA